MDSLNKWSSAFEEADPLLRLAEQMNLEDVSYLFHEQKKK